MKLFLVLLFLLNSSFTIFPVNRTTSFNNPFKIEEYIVKQKDAVKELEKILPYISFTKEVTHIPNYRITEWEYSFPSRAAKKTFLKYRYDHHCLTNKAILISLYKGLILGFLAFAGHKFLPGKIVIGATVAATVGNIMFENARIGAVPYYDEDLEKQANHFANLGVFSLFRTLCMLSVASITYGGTHQIEKGIRTLRL